MGRGPEIWKYTSVCVYTQRCPYTLTSASFYFDLYIGEKFKVGDGSAIMGRLMSGITERVPITYRVDRDIKSYIEDGAITLTSGINYCTFRENY